MKGPAEAGPPRMVIETPGAKPISLLRMFDARMKGAQRAILFRAVAARVRTGMLDTDEIEIISGWFDRLAAGESPKRVLLGETRGRRKGSTGGKYIKGEVVSLPDPIDTCWRIRRAIANGNSPKEVFAAFAQCYGVTADHISKLYKKHLPTLGADPAIQE